ncbi:MAG TPA: hypothetical protein VLM38_02180 [Blastocatellia bacterium]|nr:hypothetical protein [Blastocatellia bacterium]
MTLFRKGATRSLLVVCTAVVLASCASTRSSPAGNDSGERLEDSGRRLAGDFVVAGVEDAYRDKPAQTQSSVVLTFDENGHFKRQDNSRIEEGVYLIAGSGDLVIYIEKVNGEYLTAARVERYLIDDQRDDTMTLRGPSRSLVLRRR